MLQTGLHAHVRARGRAVRVLLEHLRNYTMFLIVNIIIIMIISIIIDSIIT